MSIHVTLRYDDPRSAITFLTGTLGFVEQQVATSDDGSVGHAELSFGDSVVMLGPRSDPPGAFDTGRAVVYLAIEGGPEAVDAHHERAVAAGATVIQALVDQPYGSREYAVTDAEGNAWCVGSYRPEVTQP